MVKGGDYVKFKELLKVHGVKQIELAKELGVSTQLITNWIKGYSKPSLVALKKISSFLKLDIDKVIECFV